MTGGVILLGFMTYFMVNRPTVESKLDNITVPVEEQNLEVEIKASGKVEPILSVNISPKNPGRLTKLLVEQGQYVKKAQPLAVMDNREIKTQGFQVEAQLQQEIANLEEAKLNIPAEIEQAQLRVTQEQFRIRELEAKLFQTRERIMKDIDQAEAQRLDAQTRLNLAQIRKNRNQSLLEDGAISRDQYDVASNEFNSAQASYLEKVSRREQLKKTADPEMAQIAQQRFAAQAAEKEAIVALEEQKKTKDIKIARLEAKILEAQASLEQIKVQFEDTLIKAPFDGIITQKYASEGAFVTPTTSASSTASATSSSIVAISKGLEIIAKVPEIDFNQLGIGQPVKIIADAYPDLTFQGVVEKIAPEAIVEQNVTSFEVTIRILTGFDKLLSKMNVETIFYGQQLTNALVVPTVAIVTENGQTGVMVIDENNEPKFKPVTIGMTIDDKTEILSGVSQGERVFTDLPESKKK